MAAGGAGRANKGSDGVFVLPEKFTIALASEYFQHLMKLVEEGQEISLDGGAVERIDAAGIQLLLVVQRLLCDAHNSLRWVKASDALRDSVDLLGLTEQLVLPADR